MSDEVDGGAECSKSEFYQLPKYTLKIILYNAILISADSFNSLYYFSFPKTEIGQKTGHSFSHL